MTLLRYKNNCIPTILSPFRALNQSVSLPPAGVSSYITSQIMSVAEREKEIPRWRSGWQVCSWLTGGRSGDSWLKFFMNKMSLRIAASSSNVPQNTLSIPNSDKSELAKVWRNEGSPSHSRNLLKRMWCKIRAGAGGYSNNATSWLKYFIISRCI